MPKHKNLFDDDLEEGAEVLKINEKYAEHYEKFRAKEEYEKRKYVLCLGDIISHFFLFFYLFIYLFFIYLFFFFFYKNTTKLLNNSSLIKHRVNGIELMRSCRVVR